MRYKIYHQKALFLLLFTSILTTTISSAQSGNEQSAAPVVYGGIGILGFNGNVGKTERVGIYNSSRFGYNFGLEELVGGGFGIGLDFLGGQLAKSERSTTANGNFQAAIMNIGINFNYHFDNNTILDENAMVAPYISVGFSYLSFKSSSDMIAENGLPYYYWNDGSVRDLPQTDATALSSQALPMDHKYETDLHALALAKEGLNYSQTTFTIPLGLGVAWKLTPEFSIDLKATYHLTMTKYIDYISGSGISTSSNDAFLYTSVSLHYNFGLTAGSSGKEAPTATANNGDDDTYYSSSKPTKNPPKAAPAPEKKPTSTTTHTKTTTMQHEAPVAKPIVANNIPEDLRIADTNNDGKISTQEINASIDALFNGDSKYSVPMINKLIDYFFEQH